MRTTSPNTTCSVPGCDRARDTRTWCHAHYKRWLRTGVPGPAAIRPSRAPVCTVEGCNTAHKAQGLCNTHYRRQQRTRHTRTKAINRRTYNRQARRRIQDLINTGATTT